MEIQILEKPIDKQQVQDLAKHWYGTMIKGCVDVNQSRIALGGDYHIESSELLTQSGSHFDSVWGFNVRFEESPDGVLEFDSMVNLKPHLGNRTRTVEDIDIQEKAGKIIRQYLPFLV